MTAHGKAFTDFTAQTGRGRAGQGRLGMLGLFREPWQHPQVEWGAKSPTGGVDQYVLFGLLILISYQRKIWPIPYMPMLSAREMRVNGNPKVFVPNRT